MPLAKVWLEPPDAAATVPLRGLKSLSDRSNVFVLGPGCAAMRTSESESVRVLQRRVAACHQRIVDSEQVWEQVSDIAARKYLEALCEQHGIDSGLATPGTDSERSVSDPLEDARARLASSLLCSSLMAAKIYCEAAISESEPIGDWRRFRPVINPQGDTARSLVSHLDAAHKNVEEFAAALARGSRELFGAEMMAESLKDLMEHLAPGRHSVRAVTGESVVWLEDLLWHVLFFDAPGYPTTRELAVQLFLLAYPYTHRSPDPLLPGGLTLSLSTMITQTPTKRAALVRRIMEAADKGRDPMRDDFFDCLAAVLWHNSESSKLNGGPQQIIFTTGYDIEIEKALLRRATSEQQFHVLCPVALARGAGAKVVELKWVAATLKPLLSGESHAGIPDPQWEEITTETVIKSGVIVVRLSGCPLFNNLHNSSLAEHSKLRGSERFCSPMFDATDIKLYDATSVSEYDALSSLMTLFEDAPGIMSRVVSEYHLPDSKDELERWSGGEGTRSGKTDERSSQRPRRPVYFVGHSVSEWHTRLRLFWYLYRAPLAKVNFDEQQRDGSRAYVVSRDGGDLRASLLQWLGVHWVVADGGRGASPEDFASKFVTETRHIRQKNRDGDA